MTHNFSIGIDINALFLMDLTDAQLLQIILLLQFPYPKTELVVRINKRKFELGNGIIAQIIEILTDLSGLKSAQKKSLVSGNYNLKKAGSLEWFGPTEIASNVSSGYREELIGQLSFLVGYPNADELELEEEEEEYLDDFEMRIVRG